MGNQLVSLAPSQIYPVEHYVADIQGIVQFESSLGSTRFFKVAKCRAGGGGPVVVKVFVIHDPSLPMRAYQEKLVDLRRVLRPTFNCLPFTKLVLNEKAAFILRQYVKYSVYDRLSTRPFLSVIEKKWIAFQLMSAVEQAHGLSVCHGDIKLENLLVTSWSWVLLTDFAPFKPIFLPEDNPADFSYFFDTSRRRSCYIAPERFKSRTLSLDTNTSLWSSSTNLGSQSGFLPDDVEDFKRGELTPPMDVFSVGCSLAELFTDGSPPFDFSQLLAYRSDEYSPEQVLERIEDVSIRGMVARMLTKDPAQRGAISEHLAGQRGVIFPEYFYSFLQAYMRMFSHRPLMSADQKIGRIYRDLERLDSLLKAEDSSPERLDTDCLLIITSLVTSCIRDLKLTSSKLESLTILTWLAERQSSEVILERILPFYIHHLGAGSPPAVQHAAVDELVVAMRHVTYVPRAEVNTFPEYILPALLPLCQYHHSGLVPVRVRAALARRLADIAELAVSFLDLVALGGGGPEEATATVAPLPSAAADICSYDTEVTALHDMLSQAVTLLLEDPDNAVKQELVHHGAARLAVFFGRQRANDVLLSHMITFLNDKTDAQLRHAFFHNIAGVAAFVGWQCSPILKPLLQQGLADPEEFVVARAIDAIAALVRQGLLEKVAMFELLRDTLPFLMHPNLWIRQAAVGVVEAMATRLDTIDVQVKVGSLLHNGGYLKQSIVCLEDPAIVLSALKEPIPRPVLDAVIRCNDVPGFLALLEDRQAARRISRSSGGGVVAYNTNDLPPQFRQLLIRLVEAGMLPTVEDQLIGLAWYIRKVARQRPTPQDRIRDQAAASVDKLSSSTRRSFTETRDRQATSRTEPLSVLDIGLDTCRKWTVSLLPDGPRRLDDTRLTAGAAAADLADIVAAEEWQNLSKKVSNVNTDSGGSGIIGGGNSGGQLTADRDGQAVTAPCKQALEQLLAEKMRECSVQAAYRDSLRQEMSSGGRAAPVVAAALAAGWRPRGLLVAHLTEHKGPVTGLVAVPETTLLASTSADGTLRIWDCTKMEGRNIANKARQVYNRHAPLDCVTASKHHLALATAARDGAITVFNIEKQSMLASRSIDTREEGAPMELVFNDAGNPPLLFYTSAFGLTVGWDLRKPGNAVEFRSELRHGLTTAMCLDREQELWLATGTSDGVVACWDLRFGLQVATLVHPAKARVRRLLSGFRSGQVLVSVQGNNEVGCWSLESASRQQVLWASNAPPLALTQPSQHSVCGMALSGKCLLTGGTDNRVRYWNPSSPSDCCVLGVEGNFTYKSRLVDGTEVLQETGRINRKTEDGKLQVDIQHQDWVTNLTLVQTTQKLLVTGANDGIVKVWK